MKYNLHKEPNWFYEVAACISEYYLNSEDKVIENHSKFGTSQEEMEKLFSKYKAYKKAVLNEILPIYNRYPTLEWLFKPVDYEADVGGPMGLSIISFWGHKANKDLNDDFIHNTIIEYISRTISDIINDVDKEDIKIEDIAGLLDILESIKIYDDLLKMHLIRLYHTRYETIRNLWDLIHACVPILKKHFHIIKDHVDLLLEEVYDEANLEKILDLSVGVKIKLKLDCDLYPTLYAFNSFKWELQGEENYSYIGIYFLKLVELKEKNKFNEDELVSDLKALGDPTRLKIIRILLEKEMYLKELAESLNLTPATVSHHINTMLKSDLIFITIGDEDNRRIYYEVNRKKLESIGNAINRLSAI